MYISTPNCYEISHFVQGYLNTIQDLKILIQLEKWAYISEGKKANNLKHAQARKISERAVKCPSPT